MRARQLKTVLLDMLQEGREMSSVEMAAASGCAVKDVNGTLQGLKRSLAVEVCGSRFECGADGVGRNYKVWRAAGTSTQWAPVWDWAHLPRACAVPQGVEVSG